MRTCAIVIMILLPWMVTGCTTVPPSLSPEPTVTAIIPPKQPEPSRPRVGGEVSGVPDGTLVTIHIRTLEGWETRTVKGPFPGRWESIVTIASGTDYVITAEAEGYVSQPVSYTIHISDDTAYVVRDGQVTDEEAIHLDFHFLPKDSP
ncbi:MAG: hypothetical protein KatS3mg053_1788 [Candidatus Roseilinea sp.]|nr:MAG: hypothetical protein KatS3mg053_1788 [Candidatus Roseilinea sp.]GIW61116.1 MAG: hypothetical protein KatS3mg087_2182 [Patescibacteria group bacterium]